MPDSPPTTEMGKAAILIPADHPAIADPENHRQPVRGCLLYHDRKQVVIEPKGWIDGPVTIGEGWSVVAE